MVVICVDHGGVYVGFFCIFSMLGFLLKYLLLNGVCVWVWIFVLLCSVVSHSS